jgi:uncharacterized membrane protein YciS (DUF1049 family)
MKKAILVCGIAVFAVAVTVGSQNRTPIMIDEGYSTNSSNFQDTTKKDKKKKDTTQKRDTSFVRL